MHFCYWFLNWLPLLCCKQGDPVSLSELPSRSGLDVHYAGWVNFGIYDHLRRELLLPLEPRLLLVFVDGRVHLGKAQMAKDEELRLLLRKRGYRILELCYDSYSDKKRDELYQHILNDLR